MQDCVHSSSYVNVLLYCSAISVLYLEVYLSVALVLL